MKSMWQFSQEVLSHSFYFSIHFYFNLPVKLRFLSIYLSIHFFSSKLKIGRKLSTSNEEVAFHHRSLHICAHVRWCQWLFADQVFRKCKELSAFNRFQWEFEWKSTSKNPESDIFSLSSKWMNEFLVFLCVRNGRKWL